MITLISHVATGKKNHIKHTIRIIMTEAHFALATNCKQSAATRQHGDHLPRHTSCPPTTTTAKAASTPMALLTGGHLLNPLFGAEPSVL
jgi:hypothetical protein